MADPVRIWALIGSREGQKGPVYSHNDLLQTVWDRWGERGMGRGRERERGQGERERDKERKKLRKGVDPSCGTVKSSVSRGERVHAAMLCPGLYVPTGSIQVTTLSMSKTQG